ncbi:MAG: conjugal transfer protein TraF [Candidatus Neomarinimicrobiota bacterium]
MNKLLTRILFSLTMVSAQVASDYIYTGVEATALAGAVVANPGSSSNLYHNPAGLAEVKTLEFRAGSGKIVNLPYLDFGLVMRVPVLGSIGISTQGLKTDYSGTTLSNEQVYSFSNGFHLQQDRNTRLLLGYSLNYYTWDLGRSAGLSGDGSDGFAAASGSAFGLDVGLVAVLRNKHRVGAYLKNINSPEIGSGASTSYLPRRMNIGIAYVPFDRLVTSLNLDRLLGANQIIINGGFQYGLNDWVILRLGVQSNPNRFGGGMEVQVAGFKIGYSLLSHPVLPLTHQFGIRFARR